MSKNSLVKLFNSFCIFNHIYIFHQKLNIDQRQIVLKSNNRNQNFTVHDIRRVGASLWCKQEIQFISTSVNFFLSNCALADVHVYIVGIL